MDKVLMFRVVRSSMGLRVSPNIDRECSDIVSPILGG